MDIAVSVVVPAYNAAQSVLRGLDSLRRQSLPRNRFEVVYVDDGSTDETGPLLDAETADEPNFTVVHIENSGWPGRPRNIGVEHARGRYVFFMDDDDRLGSQALERLYRKAEQDTADIVIGRVAGVGRNAPHEVFQKPMSRASLRTHPVLLSTLTVQKLFRRGFLLDNGLAFPEGKVRLEDHMFMLRAYLATDRVSVVHDYTCYYWMRGGGAGNISFARKDPADFLASIERLFDIIDHEVEPGAFRDRLFSHWLRSKLLGLFQGPKFLRQDADRVALMHRLSGELVRKRVPERAVGRLNAISRLRATALAADDPALLRPVAEFEEDVVHRTRITGFSWEGTELVVATETVLERASTGAPVEFVREGASVYWDLPGGLLDISAVKEAAEMRKELSRTTCRAFATRAGDPAVVKLPMDVECREERGSSPGRFWLRMRGSLRIDVARADHGRALTGLWRVGTRVVIGGLGSTSLLGPDRAPGAEHTRAPAFVGTQDAARFVNPYWNTDGLLTLSAEGSWRPLRRAVRTGLPAAVSRTTSGLRVEIPLVVQAAASRTLTLTCTGEDRAPISATARVYPPPRQSDAALPLALLNATIPVPHGRGVLHVGVGEGEEYTPLGLDLYWTPLGWRIGRPGGPLPRRCAHAVTRRVRPLARRLPRPVRRVLIGARDAVGGRAGNTPGRGAGTSGAAGASAAVPRQAKRTGGGTRAAVKSPPRVGADEPTAADPLSSHDRGKRKGG